MNHNAIRLEWKRAVETLESAELLFGNQYYTGALSRAYYSVLYAAKAAFLVQNVVTASHSGLRNRFGELFIKSGIFDKEFGRIISDLYNMRSTADYDSSFEPHQDEVKEKIENAHKFLNRVKEYLIQNHIQLNNENT